MMYAVLKIILHTAQTLICLNLSQQASMLHPSIHPFIHRHQMLMHFVKEITISTTNLYGILKAGNVLCLRGTGFSQKL